MTDGSEAVLAGQDTHRAQALALLAGLRTGKVDRGAVTGDFSWWWNRDLAFDYDTFAEVLGGLHAATVDGITVTPGLVVAEGETVMVEATSQAPLKDGRVYANRYVFVIHFTGDLVREVREYSDTALVIEMFGLGG